MLFLFSQTTQKRRAHPLCYTLHLVSDTSPDWTRIMFMFRFVLVFKPSCRSDLHSLMFRKHLHCPMVSVWMWMYRLICVIMSAFTAADQKPAEGKKWGFMFLKPTLVSPSMHSIWRCLRSMNPSHHYLIFQLILECINSKYQSQCKSREKKYAVQNTVSK